MVHAGGPQVPSLINDNFERLNKVANSSGSYFWKYPLSGEVKGAFSYLGTTQASCKTL
jgi:hypothetical protein